MARLRRFAGGAIAGGCLCCWGGGAGAFVTCARGPPPSGFVDRRGVSQWLDLHGLGRGRVLLGKESAELQVEQSAC